MYFGVARDLITPDHKLRLMGYTKHYGRDYQDIHDDIYVKALMIDDGTQKVVLLTYDLCFQEFAFTQRVQRWAHEAHGIAPENLLISCTHSHTGPAVPGYGPQHLYSAAYVPFLWERTQSCITRALMNRFEGTLEVGTIPARWGVNRRRPVADSYLLAPNYEGVKDRELRLLVARDTAGDPRAVLINWGCHPVTLRAAPHVSGEFPGRLCQLLEARHFGATALFFQGAGGNIRPLATAEADRFIDCSFAEMDEMASGMAAGVSTALEKRSLHPLAPRLQAVAFQVDLPIVPWPKQRFQEVATASPGKRRGVDAQLVADAYDSMGNTVPLPCCLISLGPDVAVAGMGGEPCYEVRELVARAVPVKNLLFVGYLDAVAYIPDAKILAEGGYEPIHSVIEYHLKGAFSPEIDAVIVTAFAGAWSKLSN